MRTIERILLLASATVLAAVFTGCVTARSREANAAQGYLDFLRQHPGADLSGPEERLAMEGIKHYLANLSEKTVREKTRVVYAPNAWFNDSLKTKHGAVEIEEDFLKSLKNVDEIKVTYLDEVRSGNEYYVRWIMDIRFKKLNGGRVSRTVGMTHVRFNEAGQVLVHQDFWDSAQGFYQHVPVIGGGIRLIRSMF